MKGGSREDQGRIKREAREDQGRIKGGSREDQGRIKGAYLLISRTLQLVLEALQLLLLLLHQDGCLDSQERFEFFVGVVTRGVVAIQVQGDQQIALVEFELDGC
jgi:hypothetical protein